MTDSAPVAESATTPAPTPDTLHGSEETLRYIARLERECDEARKENEALRDAIPEGCTPTDARVLREANGALATENQQLRQALRFYAHRMHIVGFAKWEGPGGEDNNWLCPPEDEELATFVLNIDESMIEDGAVAKLVLRGQRLEWDDEAPDPIEGEPEFDALRAALREGQRHGR